MKRKLITTDDGSHTFEVEDLNEHYHSTYGALAESRHVFIEAGLLYKLGQESEQLNIIEVGFGTGLNALLSIFETTSNDIRINYFALDAYPLEKELTGQLNYAELIDRPDAEKVFSLLHSSVWGKPVPIGEGFVLNKIEQKLEDYTHEGGLADLVYFDAFGPDVQPELWTEEIFEKIAAITRTGGILVTYSCKGSVKRALKSAGFEIEKLPGPTGKREMIRGVRC